MRAEDAIERSVGEWLERAVADARLRGLPELEPMLRGLARSTIQLRRADWNLNVPGVTLLPDRLREGQR